MLPVERGQLGIGDVPEPANAGAVRLDAAPAARADDPQLETRTARTLRQPREVLARLERPDREDVVAVGGRSAVPNASPAASGITRIRSSGTPSSSVTSRLVKSEIVITRAAALTARGTKKRL